MEFPFGCLIKFQMNRNNFQIATSLPPTNDNSKSFFHSSFISESVTSQ